MILVDWQPLAANTFYLGPMRNTEKVGQTAAEFIDFLVKETGLKPEVIHFIGMCCNNKFKVQLLTFTCYTIKGILLEHT